MRFLDNLLRFIVVIVLMVKSQERLEMTREEIIKIAGDLDEALIIEIIHCGATSEELLQAFEWVFSDDTISRETHRQPWGRVAKLCTILERSETIRESDRRQD